MRGSFRSARVRRRLGQHFLADRAAAVRMVSISSVGPSDVVLEVGAGLGLLTSEIASRARRVVAVEKDPRLVIGLRNMFSENNNVEIVPGDVFKIDLPEFNKVVSTPPYSISSRLLFYLLRYDFEVAVMTFQSEFAKRLIAPCSSPEYGRLTVMANLRAAVTLHDEVPKTAFTPPPRVNSRIVEIRHRPSPVQGLQEELIEQLVREFFSQRRRLTRKVLSQFIKRSHPSARLAMVANNGLLEKRVYQLTLEDFVRIACNIASDLAVRKT